MACPICRNETARDHRPFCSRRCADIDLGRWMNGAYAVPSQDEEEPSDTTDAPPKPH